ncbi:MAG TPA: insulinase family protein [Allosphingosinicella sp.]|nr:insulinase family protein [Allosphingosinicella sp.]
MMGRRLGAAAAFLLFAAAPATALAPPSNAKVVSNENASKTATEPVIAPDPAVRTGTLPNGFRYKVMRNKGPAGAVSIRLIVKVGSFEEADDQLGYAHFIEHMAFRSTKFAPGGILDNPFAAMGVALGRDQNAFTTIASTTYGVDVPAANPDGLRRILDWMRSAMDGIAFTPAAVGMERGVLLSELRTRSSPVLVAQQDVARFQLPGLRSVSRYPGGTEASLNSATPARLQAFYDRWYRPENAMLVIVGDAPADQLEALAKQAFSGWSARGAAGVRPALPSAFPARGFDAMTEGGDALPPAFSICRFAPKAQPAADMVERLRRDFYSRLWALILEKRFDHLSASGASPLVGAKVLSNDEIPDARGTCFLAMPTAGRWKEALRVEQNELRRFDRDGPTRQELDDAMEQLRAPMRGAELQADSRTSESVADAIAADDDKGLVFTTPAETLRTFGIATGGVTTADIKKAFEQDWSGVGPLVVAMGPAAPPKEAVAAAWRENEAAPAPAAYADVKSVAWPYRNFGAAGTVARRETFPDFVRLHFGNGTILNFKQTDFKTGNVEVRIRFGRGESGVPAADRAAVEVGVGMVPEGGLGRIDYEQIGAAFASTDWKFGLSVDPTAFVLTGHPMNDQVARELQLLAAYMTDPGFRPDLDTKMSTAVDFIYRYFRTEPMAVATDAIEQRLFANVGALPPKPVALGWRAADFARLLKPALTRSPVAVTIVGDLKEADAIAAVADTFGALPARPALPPEGPGSIRHFPADLPREITAYHQGPREKAAAILMWPLYTAVPERRKEEHALSLLAGIFRERLFHETRVRLGKVYEADVSNPMPDYGDQGWMSAEIQATPADLDALIGVARTIAADLAAGNIRQDELDRARQLLVAARTPLQKENGPWAGAISDAAENPHIFDDLLLYPGEMAALTLDDVRKAASTWLKREPLVVRSLPQPPATAAAAH